MLSNLLLQLAVVSLALGVPIAAVGLHFRRRIRGFNARAVAAHAVVVRHEPFTSTATDPMRRMTQAWIRFTTQDGRVVEARGPTHDHVEPPMPPLGSRVAVVYDPSNPDEVSIHGPRGQGGCATAMVWIGLGFALFALAAAGARFLLAAGMLG